MNFGSTIILIRLILLTMDKGSFAHLAMSFLHFSNKIVKFFVKRDGKSRSNLNSKIFEAFPANSKWEVRGRLIKRRYFAFFIVNFIS